MGAGNASAAAYEAWRAGGIAARASAPPPARPRKRARPRPTGALYDFSRRVLARVPIVWWFRRGHDGPSLPLYKTLRVGEGEAESRSVGDPPTLGSACEQQHVADGSAAAGTVEPARRAPRSG